MPKNPIEDLIQQQREIEQRVPVDTFWAETASGNVHRIIGHTMLVTSNEALVNNHDVRNPKLNLSTPANIFLGEVSIGGKDPEPRFRQVNRI